MRLSFVVGHACQNGSRAPAPKRQRAVVKTIRESLTISHLALFFRTAFQLFQCFLFYALLFNVRQ